VQLHSIRAPRETEAVGDEADAPQDAHAAPRLGARLVHVLVELPARDGGGVFYPHSFEVD